MKPERYPVNGFHIIRVPHSLMRSTISVLLFLVLLHPVHVQSQTTPFSFTPIPFGNTDIISPGRGFEHWFNWNNWDNLSTVQVPAGNTQVPDLYIRINWAQIENPGTGTTPANPRYNWSTFDMYLNNAIAMGKKLNFGVLTISEGYAPYGSPGGFDLSYPLYLHNQMQAEAANSRDWTSASTGMWVPNWNSPNYLAAVDALNAAIADHINTGSYNGVAYKNIVNIIDVRGYGHWGEWNSANFFPEYPSGRFPTAASLKTIVNSFLTRFPNNPLVAMTDGFKNDGWASNPPEVTHYLLTAANSWGPLGWRRDNWGQEVQDEQLINNPGSWSGVAFAPLIMDRWKSSPVTGEPNNGGTFIIDENNVPYGYLPREVRRYHASSIGNGNFQSSDISTQRSRDSIIAASKWMGYRISLESGNMTTSLSGGTPFSVTLNWRNLGIAPTYENWDVYFELRNASNVAVWTGASSFKPKRFLPAAAATTVTDNFTLPVAVASGTYNLVLIIKDPAGYRKPLPLAITGRAGDGSYLLRSVTVGAPSLNQPPVANASTDQIITLPQSSVTLNGTLSSDPDGTISTYSWTKISGPAGETLQNPTSASTLVSGLAVGSFFFKLSVTDNAGATDTDTVIVTVNPAPNQAPNANVGADIAITLPTNSTTLNGTASNDPDGTISTYSWTKISGPATFTIASPAAASSALTNLVQGSYSFRLLVTDNAGAQDADTVIVTVNPAPNQAPNANAGADIAITLPTNSTTLNGTASNDPDGTISTYSWTKISGPATFTIASPAAASSALTNLVQGTYSFRLLVTDNAGAQDADTVIVTVNPAPNQAPNANAGADIAITLPINSTTLNGTASNDPDGTISTYSWTKISGPATFTIASPAAASSALTNLVQGTYSFRLLVTDNAGAQDADTVIVTVNPAPNQAPNANAGADIAITLPINSTTLNGTASNDPDGTIVTYNWVKVSGPGAVTITNSTTATPGVLGLQQGIHIFELTVTDNNGIQATDRVTVTVQAAANQPPVAKAGNDTTIISPASVTILNGSASFDADGTITNWQWRQLTGPAAASIQSPAQSITSVSALQDGEYSFELTVMDNAGLTGKDTLSVIVMNLQRTADAFKIYPNPTTNGSFNLLLNTDSVGEAMLNIYTINGVLVKSVTFNKGQYHYDGRHFVTELKAAVYIVEVVINGKKRMVTKLIRQ